ncbi:MAG TPA: DUF362 domain-containing protein [Terriglobales bacterium]|nr:DUF362 domain-containing protein [Terriglobales bacterium]
MSITRRELIVGSAALAAGSAITTPFFLPKFHFDHRLKRSRVAVLNAHEYSHALDQILATALRLFPINVRGKTVVLKPNLVDFIPGNAINTHTTLVLAAAEAFRHLDAKSVVVAEGPGHQRDTQLVLSQTGYEQSLRDERIRFVDLNRDELIRTPLRASYTGMKELWLPRTVLEADFLVSMPKIKAHHWSGVTLSMKNMFGVVPGAHSRGCEVPWECFDDAHRPGRRNRCFTGHAFRGGSGVSISPGRVTLVQSAARRTLYGEIIASTTFDGLR